MDTKTLLTIIGLSMTFIFGILRYVIKEKKKLQKNKTDGLYYEDGDANSPYCPNCYENKRKRILIGQNDRKCPKCKTVFERPPVVIEVCPSPGPKFRI